MTPGDPSPVPAQRSHRAPVPDDPALPRLPVLLDPEAIAPFLHRSLGPDAPLPDVRVHYLRYKPGTNIVVGYDVGLDGRRYDAVAMIKAGRSLARRAEKPENVALARLVDGRSPAAMPLHYDPELDALIQWFPLDLDLPTLAEPPARLLDELEAAGMTLGEVDGEPATLAYKPRRRAVLRVGEHVLKIYAHHEEFAAAAVGLRAAAALCGGRTATVHGDLATKLVIVQAALSGLRPSEPADVALEAGQLLHDLHKSPARSQRTALPLPGLVAGDLADGPHADRETDLAAAEPPHQLAAAERSVQLVTALLPTLRSRVQTLLHDLEAEMPSIDHLVPTHGDFNIRQLLVRPDGVAAIDFDAMCLAPAALDPATYASFLVHGEPDDLDEAMEVLEELLDGYGDRPDGLSWYLATCILRRSPFPFRYLDEHWPERIEGMIAASEAALRR
jgi:hypothetical protein